MSNHPLEIKKLYNDDEAFLMSRGHHDPAAFRAQAVRDEWVRASDGEDGDEIEAPVHGYMRCVPRRGGWDNWHEPANGPGPGAFPVTTALCYYACRAAQAAAKGAIDD